MTRKRAEGLEKAYEFLGSRTGLLTNVAGVSVYLMNIDQHMRILLEVGEATTGKQLRRVIPEALRLRDRLVKLQGPYVAAGANQYLETILRWHAEGMSYADIAVEINARVAALLEAYRDFERDPENMDWYFNDGVRADPFALESARYLLLALRLKPAEIDGLLDEGLKRLRAGNLPFDAEYPVSRKKVIDVLNYWRRKRKAG